MNINFPVYKETHHVTNCIHDHNGLSKQMGGISSRASIENTRNEQPETLQDSLKDMENSFGYWRTSREPMSVGNGLGSTRNGFSEESRETLVQLPLERNTENGILNRKGISLISSLLNTLPVPEKMKQRFLSVKGAQERTKVSMNFELSAKGQKEKEHFSSQTQAKQLYRRIREWLQIKIPSKSQEQSFQTADTIYLEGEYLLDSYDRNGQYRQLERKGILEEGLDKRA